MDSKNLLKHIFTSTTRIDLMSYFLRNSSEEIYMSMIKNDLGHNLSTYQKELDNLVEIGYLTEQRKSKLRFFRLNTSFVFYDEIRSIFQRSLLVEDELTNVLKKYENVEYSFIYEKSVQKQMVMTVRVLVIVVAEVFAERGPLVKELRRVLKSAYERCEIEVVTLGEMSAGVREGNQGIVDMVNAEKKMLFHVKYSAEVSRETARSG